MTTFTGKQVDAFAMLTLAKALELYAQAKVQVNRAYTPKNMMASAAKFTGQTFKARDYLGAAAALQAKAKEISQ